MLIFYHHSLKNWLSKDIFDFLPPGKGVHLLEQGVRLFGLFFKHAGGTFIREEYAKFCKKIARGTFIREGTFIRDRIVFP